MIRSCADTIWRDLIVCVSGAPQSAPRGKLTAELLCHQTVTDMSRCIVTNRARNMGMRFAATEAWWIMSGRNELRELGKFSKYMESFSDDGVRLSGAYGPMFGEQVRYVMETLASDPDTRQAVATFWRPNPRSSRDVPCTVSLQWMIRRSTLHCSATMRSSDVWLGWPYDVFTFSMLSAYIALELKFRTSTSLTASLGVPMTVALELGNLYLTAGSQHLYVESDGPNPGLDYAVKNVVDGPFVRKEYATLDLSHFVRGLDLQDHLRSIKDGDYENAKSPWVVELLS